MNLIASSIPILDENIPSAEYVQAFIQFSIAMHQIDPTIQVFGPEISQYGGPGYRSYRCAVENIGWQTFLTGREHL